MTTKWKLKKFLPHMKFYKFFLDNFLDANLFIK